MKKSNVILALVLTAASIFLLWLWFYLGFNMVDNPIDLTVSIVWWVVIVAAIALIVRAEKKRQQAIRTVLVGEGQVFSPELGIVKLDADDTVTSIEAVIEKLEYGFKKHDLPGSAPERYSVVVKSPVFKVRKTVDENGSKQLDWEGEVIFIATGETASFASREELEKILAA